MKNGLPKIHKHDNKKPKDLILLLDGGHGIKVNKKADLGD